VLEQLLPRRCGYGCGRMLTRATRWVAAHVVDGDPSAGYVASCEICNQRAKHSALWIDPALIVRIPMRALHRAVPS